MKNILFLTLAVSLLLGGCTLSDNLKSVGISQEPSANNTETPIKNESTVTEEKPTNNKNSLDLSNQQLSKIPDQTFKQSDLEELNVSNNQLTGAIQAEIRQLQKLRVLNASNNSMTLSGWS